MTPQIPPDSHTDITMMKAVAALALFESVSAFQAPLAAKSVRAAPQMFSEGDIGVLPPLGVFDPLGLIETRDMRRYEIMEIKHGRAAMLGFLHVMVLTCMQEAGTGFASKPQDPDVEAGDIALDSWVRYDDPEVKTFKLNAERQND